MLFTHTNGEEEVVEVKPIWEFKSEEKLKKENSGRVLCDYEKLATLNFSSIAKKYLVISYPGFEEYRPIIFRRAVLSIFPHTKLGYKIVLITC